jgi:uncharacterized protein YjbJ (UPF0337 family)
MGNKLDKFTGRIKEKLGKALGSKNLQAEGRAEQVAGNDGQTATDFHEVIKGERPPD